jgi:hypothetical protein
MKNKNDKQKVLQVGSKVWVPVMNKYRFQGTVTEITDDNVTVDVPTYYIPGVITNTFKKNEIKLVSNECPKRKGE